MHFTAEHQRLAEYRNRKANWKKWGPYLSERSWGTVREDYSTDGSAWEFFPHDHARSRAYRWGEDGLAAICDRYQLLVFSLALLPAAGLPLLLHLHNTRNTGIANAWAGMSLDRGRGVVYVPTGSPTPATRAPTS